MSEQHKTVDETVQLEMDTFQSRTGTFPIVSKEPVHVVAEHVKGRELLIHVDTELCILIPCDRCLEDVFYAVKTVRAFATFVVRT